MNLNFKDLTAEKIRDGIKLRKDYSFVVIYEMLLDTEMNDKSKQKDSDSII